MPTLVLPCGNQQRNAGYVPPLPSSVIPSLDEVQHVPDMPSPHQALALQLDELPTARRLSDPAQSENVTSEFESSVMQAYSDANGTEISLVALRKANEEHRLYGEAPPRTTAAASSGALKLHVYISMNHLSFSSIVLCCLIILA